MSFKIADKVKGREVLPTGVKPLELLLDGGLKIGLTHLFYGSTIARDILHMILVYVQHSSSSTIIINSGNTINVEKITLSNCPEGDTHTRFGVPVNDFHNS